MKKENRIINMLNFCAILQIILVLIGVLIGILFAGEYHRTGFYRGQEFCSVVRKSPKSISGYLFYSARIGARVGCFLNEPIFNTDES